MNWIEVIGIVATIVVLLSFFCSDIKKIRVINGIGSVLFVIYGVLIHSISVSILNFCIIIVQVIKLNKSK